MEELTNGGNEFILPSLEATVLAVSALVACLLCMYMVFFFGRRLQTSAYLRESLVEGAKMQELKVMLLVLRDKAVSGPLDSKDPPPFEFGPPAQLWTEHLYDSYREALAPEFPPHTGDYKTEGEWANARRLWEQEDKERLQALDKCIGWEKRERERFEKLRLEAEEKAQIRADKKIPESIDISLLGGGWAFLLEFSTVIVIIFALVIMGILGTLKGTEISTILAAIAGYVLGKAATAAKQPQRKPTEGERSPAV